MTKIVSFPTEETKIRREACKWIVLMDRGNLPKKKISELNEWVCLSDFHKEELERLAHFWDRISDVGIDPDQISISQGGHEESAANSTTRASRLYKILASLAASLLIIASVSLLLYFQNINEFQSTNGKYLTNIGGQKTVLLSDGSEIRLNTDTLIEVNYHDGERIIHLYKGEAQFDVAHDAEKPFTVKAKNGDVRALGTIFSVRLKNNQVNVLVEEGRVRIRANDDINQIDYVPVIAQEEIALEEIEHDNTMVIVNAGNNVTFGDQIIESVIMEERESLERKFSWRQGILAFDDEPLSDVIDEVSRYTSYKIIVADPNIRSLRVGGYYPIGKIQAIFNALELNLGLEISQVDEQTYYITRK